MDPRYSIVRARPQDLSALPAIERAAARLLEGYAPESVLNEATDMEDFRQAQAEDRLWVALDGSTPVGFAHIEIHHRDVHLEEIDVHPEHGRRGLGAALVREVCAAAARGGFASVTLTTFKDLSWNMPFYRRLGFEVVPDEQLTDDLRAVVSDEQSRGLDPSRRVVMRYALPHSSLAAAHPTIDALLEGWREDLGSDFTAYRNHAQRVFNLAAAHCQTNADDRERLAIAAAFHDAGIWLDGTFDYIEPSARRAEHYLAEHGHQGSVPVVGTMIREHHKITPWRGEHAPIVEAFRRADWLDVCLFLLPTRTPRALRTNLLAAFPRAGFHRRLVELGFGWSCRHPLRPLPMIKL